MRPIVFILVSCQCISLVKLVVSSSVSRQDYSEIKLFQTPAAYDVESSLMLNDIEKTDKDVGYKIKAQLHVQPLWADSYSEFLLQFNLKSPQLHLRGKHINADYRAFSSVWDSYRDTTFYVHWKNGVVQTAYLDPKELLDVLNYKKALISLFQFQIIDGEYNETDISGVCDVLYQSISSTVFRKVKRTCSSGEDDWELESEAGSQLALRRVARYTLGGAGEGQAALQAVYADELLELGGPELGVKARSLHHVRAAPGAPAVAPAPAPSLPAALQALPAGVEPTPLQLTAGDWPEDDLDLDAALAAHADVLATEGEAGAGGRRADAAAALSLLPALTAAPPARLRALLERDAAPALLGVLCRLVGLSGSAAGVAAASSVLQLSARDPPVGVAREFLAGFSLAPAPAAAAVAAVARLATEAREPTVAAAALLAASAAAARLPPAAREAQQDALRDHIARDLPKCKDDLCRTSRLHALGHLRREDGVELLLAHAAGAPPAAAAAALRALAAAPPPALHARRRRRLEAIACLPGRPLEVRAMALDLLVLRSADKPYPLVALALALRRAPGELRRVLWQRLRQLAPQHDKLREMLPLFPRELRTWDAQAHPGTSSLLVRDTGLRVSGLAAALESRQLAARGLLRRGAVLLRTRRRDNSTADLLEVEVWARGLEAVAGAGPGGDEELYEGEEAAETAAGLELAVAGVRLPPVDLFRGQAELLGHVWAGTGSAPTPALRALHVLRPLRVLIPLQVGRVVRAQYRVAVSLALDAHAQVSLWSRSARSGLELRAGAAGAAGLEAGGAGAGAAGAGGAGAGGLRARAWAGGEPRLRVGADLDFYDAVALCVRVRLDDCTMEKQTHLESVQGARPLTVSRWRNASEPRPGRSLALGRAAAACRALAAADDHQ